ncbi:adenylate/guanylate cyclase domain-containing protein [bacterium]|nr:adenylate/guanylate cyclase domain-containing protein [bacterium]
MPGTNGAEPGPNDASPSKGKKRVSWWLGILASAALAAISMLGGRLGILYDLELKSYDARFLIRGPESVDHSDIIIVDLDDESFSTLPQRYPFPRSYYAKMVENLFAAGARLIVFDVQFLEPSDPAEDQALADATETYKDKIIHAAKISFTRNDKVEEVIERALVPIKPISDTGVAKGIVNEIKDPDGFTRQYPIFIHVDSTSWLPLGVKALQLLADIPDTARLYPTDHGVKFGSFEIPRMASDGEPTMLTNFYGPARTFPTFSFAHVLDTEDFDLLVDDTDYMKWFTMSDEQFALLEMLLPPEAVEPFRELRSANPFRDKIVFLGASTAELQDLKRTPFYSYTSPDGRKDLIETPGVETHANALQTILDEAYIYNVPPVWEYLLILTLTILVFLLNNSTKLVTGSLFTLGLGLVLTIIVFYLFIEHRIWVALIAPLTSIVIAYLATTLYHAILEQREKAMIRGMFAQYVPQKVVSELIQNPDMLKLGGERRRMTALFTDVAGFTSISEKMSPEELVGLLNEYLSEMSNIILDNEGIIDKYEGDLIMAEWGAPVFFEDHATWACRAALKMQRRLGELRGGWEERGIPRLASRVGINTGPMIVGNMGCLEVFDYTVMGDAVNLASRLEGANKSYGTTIMIGPETWADVNETFVTRMLDDLRVKGKGEPVRVYELMGEDLDNLLTGHRDVIPLYNEGIELYRSRMFAEGKAKFEQALAIDPEDGPSKTYLERCIICIENPPPDDWDCVFELTEK